MWSGNLFDFFFRVNRKLAESLKTPFKLDGIFRVDDTPMHKAVREALANCLFNADYHGVRGVVVRRTPTSWCSRIRVISEPALNRCASAGCLIRATVLS